MKVFETKYSNLKKKTDHKLTGYLIYEDFDKLIALRLKSKLDEDLFT